MIAFRNNENGLLTLRSVAPLGSQVNMATSTRCTQSCNWPVVKKRRGCPVSTVIPIKRLFEAHIIVRDLRCSVAFYRDVLGLEVGIEQPERPAAFFWVGGRGKSM